MNPLTLINAIANAIVAGAVADLALRVFGRPDHPIHGQPLMVLSRKFVSSIVICGAVLNIITLSTPSWTEVLLNVGFSLNYLWSSYYDRNASPSNTKPPAEVSKRRATSRSSGSGKASPRSATSRKRGQRSSS